MKAVVGLRELKWDILLMTSSATSLQLLQLKLLSIALTFYLLLSHYNLRKFIIIYNQQYQIAHPINPHPLPKLSAVSV
jgi:hypothetical protein